MSSLFLQFSIFATVASITPGPTNLLALASGQRFGWRPTLPFAIGASFGASTILLLTGLGLASWLVGNPLLRNTMAWAGTLWLSYLAIKLFRAGRVDLATPQHQLPRPGWLSGAGLQWVNPKTWIMAITVSSLFPAAENPIGWHYPLLAIVFFLITNPCIALWAWVGQGTGRWLHTPSQIGWLNKALAVLLLGSVWVALLS